jgi:hypothetical protein
MCLVVHGRVAICAAFIASNAPLPLHLPALYI